MPRSARIRREAEIRALFRRGKRKRTRNLEVFVSASPALRPRLGLVVPRHGRKIVQRNRLKRRLREAARCHLLPRCRERGVDLDILLRARASAYDTTYEELENELIDLSIELC